jgi:NTP pyrophosphatase (non-canonical NTP hydrolase)
MKDWDLVMDQLIAFREEREWKQFHNPKDLALAISIEAAELNELFLWKSPDQADKEKVKEELADIFSFALLLVKEYDLDINEIVLEKIKKNALKYPVDKAKGSAKKYDEL